MGGGAWLGGFIQMMGVTLRMSAAVYFRSRHVAGFSERVKMLVLAVLAAAIFMRLGDPIWYHHGWGHAIYLFVADTIMLLVAGVIILKLLPAAIYRGAGSGAPTDV